MCTSNSIYHEKKSSDIFRLHSSWFDGFSFETKSQTAEELQQINAGAKVIYVKAESLDQLMIRLRPFENNLPAGQESLMMDTYRTIANGYAVNNHFKQAYEVYKRYLLFKENYYLKIKSDAINPHRLPFIPVKMPMKSWWWILQNQLSQLQIENDRLISKTFPILKIFLGRTYCTQCFIPSLLVGSGIKLNSIHVKTETKQGTDERNSQDRRFRCYSECVFNTHWAIQSDFYSAGNQ